MNVVFKLKEVREAKGLSQYELAVKTEMSPQNVQKMEQGRTKGIQFDTLLSLCLALDCEPGDLLTLESEEQSDR